MRDGPDRPFVDVKLEKCRRPLACVVLFSLAISLMALAVPVYTLQVYDRVLTGGSVDTLLHLTVLALFTMLSIWWLDVARTRVLVKSASWLRQAVAPSALLIDMNVRSARQSGDRPLLDDVDALCRFIAGPALLSLIDMPWTLVFLGVLFLLHPVLGWICLAGIATLIGLALACRMMTSRHRHLAMQLTEEANAAADAMRRTARLAVQQGCAERLVEKWSGNAAGAVAEQVGTAKPIGILSGGMKFLRQALHIAIIAVGAWLVLQNVMTAGGLIAASILGGRVLAPFEQTLSLWDHAAAARSSLRRLRAIADGEEGPAADQTQFDPALGLVADKAAFAYPHAKEPAVHGIDFKVLPGTAVGVIGPTASGKSTLGKMLAGLAVPQFGDVRIGGVGLGRLNSEARSNRVGYLPQHNSFLPGNVRDNIAGFRDCEPKAVEEAAVLAGVHEDILAFKDGYDTDLSQADCLSAGQKQRIALARAVFGKPDLVVLDDPGTCLDLQGECALGRMITGLRDAGSITVIISQRPSLLRKADRIVVLRDGRIEMNGPSDEILARVSAVAADIREVA